MPTFDEVLRAIAEQEMPESEHDLIETFQESTSFWANKNLSMTREWIIKTDLMLEKTLDDTNVQDFYIKLCGIIHDLYDHYLEKVNHFKKVFEKEDVNQLEIEINKMSGNISMRNYLISSLKLFEDIEKLRHQFNDSELEQIRFFRHLNCHPMLTSYSVKINKQKKFTRIEKDKIMRQIADADELEVIEVLYQKVSASRSLIKNMNDRLRTMQFA
jgi:hypothetical protein